LFFFKVRSTKEESSDAVQQAPGKQHKCGLTLNHVSLSLQSHEDILQSVLDEFMQKLPWTQ
jgi:hypothetical protein